jgi:pimeloyl-ACP methyl ester carboxylesterase
VRQPEVARLLRLLLAVVLVLPVLGGLGRLGVATAFLLEFAGDGWPALSRLTPAPLEGAHAIPGVVADRFTPRTRLSPTPLVLVPGATPDGKDDARARRAARLLARAGFDVTLPTIAGLTRGRLRPDDVTPVVAALAAAARPAVVVAVSVGSGPALLAATDPTVRDRVALVLSLGGYGSAAELVRFYLTGAYDYGPVSGHRRHDPDLVRAFVAANADLLDESTRPLLEAGGEGRAGPLLAAVAPPVRALLETLSPVRVVRDLRARLVLVHGRDDVVVPFTESLRLADAAPRGRTTLVVVDTLGHVGSPGGARLTALARLWGVAYVLISAA